MEKKYIVRLSDEERQRLQLIVKTLSGSPSKVKRANILLKADVEGPNWTDQQIATDLDCRIKTVENVRQRLINHGLEKTLNGQPTELPRRFKCLDGDQEAKLIALRLSPPPKGYHRWTLRLLAEQVVVLEIAESISHETVRQTLKKMA